MNHQTEQLKKRIFQYFDLIEWAAMLRIRSCQNDWIDHMTLQAFSVQLSACPYRRRVTKPDGGLF